MLESKGSTGARQTKSSYHLKLEKKSACSPVNCSGSSHVHFMNVAVQLANWWHMILIPSSRACRALREMPRSPRLAHKAPVMQATVCSLLSRKRALLLRFAVYEFGTQKLINQEIFSFISNTCFVLVLCLRWQRCQIGLPQITHQFASQSHLVWDHSVHWLLYFS